MKRRKEIVNSEDSKRKRAQASFKATWCASAARTANTLAGSDRDAEGAPTSEIDSVYQVSERN